MEELGTGVLGWSSAERRSNRYGSVMLFPSPNSEKPMRFVQVKAGKGGRLIAVVQETRQSRHVGDIFYGVFPKTPQMGQQITLGEGALFFEDDSVGLQPDDGRDAQWLNMRALYDALDQTITLYFDEFPTN